MIDPTNLYHKRKRLPQFAPEFRKFFSQNHINSLSNETCTKTWFIPQFRLNLVDLRNMHHKIEIC